MKSRDIYLIKQKQIHIYGGKAVVRHFEKLRLLRTGDKVKLNKKDIEIH